MMTEFPPVLSGELWPVPLAVPVSTSPRPDTFRRVLERVGTEVDRGERLIRGVIDGRGGALGAGQLIALQAGIYRYTEIVDLSAKLIDRASNAVRTTLQSGT